MIFIQKKNKINHNVALEFETFLFQYLSNKFAFKSFLEFLKKNDKKHRRFI